MSHKFSDFDKKIFFKLAPEATSIVSKAGHEYPFILRPISHVFSKSSLDFQDRIQKLNKEEINYIANLILEDKEELRSLEEEDMISFLNIIESKISKEKKEQIKNHIGIL